MQEKLSQSSKAIVLQGKHSLQIKTDEEQKSEVISEYLEKYALIANRTMTPELYGIYVEALRDLPLSRIKAGLKEWLESGDKFPWPANIREAGEL